MPSLTPDEMKGHIGVESVSDWVEVSQTMIDRFAEATGDHQFIHVDPERAAQTPFGGTIAHGFLTPVRSGSKVRGRFKLLSFDEKRPGQFQQTVEFSVEIEGQDKPALLAEWISQVFV